MEELITEVLALASQVLQAINSASSQKYLDDWYSNEKAIEAEMAKWPNSDDSLLEQLYQNRIDTVKAAQQELQIIQAVKPPA